MLAALFEQVILTWIESTLHRSPWCTIIYGTNHMSMVYHKEYSQHHCFC